MADDTSIDLMSGGFTRGMLAELEQKMVLDAFSKHVEDVAYHVRCVSRGLRRATSASMASVSCRAVKVEPSSQA